MKKTPTWQPISFLPVISNMVDEMLSGAKNGSVKTESKFSLSFAV